MNVVALIKAAPVAVSKRAPKFVHRSTSIIKHYSPEILTGVGVIGVIGTTVLASRATLRLEEVVDKVNEGLEAANSLHESGNELYSDLDYKKDLTVIYTRSVIDIAKLYGPAFTLGVASVSCIVGAHGIMTKRNVALAAAYKTVEQTFNEYRKRVVNEFGEEKDQDFRRGVREEKVVNKDTGKVTTVTHVDPNGISGYARFFDETCKNWEKTPEYNLLFLKCQQNYANDLLHSRGHLFLNEVYDMVGIPRSKAGAVVGWSLSDNGDNFVDFGVYNFASEKAREFVNGQEHSILLDFNVDGVILDKISWRG